MCAAATAATAASTSGSILLFWSGNEKYYVSVHITASIRFLGYELIEPTLRRNTSSIQQYKDSVLFLIQVKQIPNVNITYFRDPRNYQ